MGGGGPLLPAAQRPPESLPASALGHTDGLHRECSKKRFGGRVSIVPFGADDQGQALRMTATACFGDARRQHFVELNAEGLTIRRERDMGPGVVSLVQPRLVGRSPVTAPPTIVASSSVVPRTRLVMRSPGVTTMPAASQSHARTTSLGVTACPVSRSCSALAAGCCR